MKAPPQASDLNGFLEFFTLVSSECTSKRETDTPETRNSELKIDEKNKSMTQGIKNIVLVHGGFVDGSG